MRQFMPLLQLNFIFPESVTTNLLVACECDSTQYPHWYYKYLQGFVCHGLPNAAQVFYGAWLTVSAGIQEQGEESRIFLIGLMHLSMLLLQSLLSSWDCQIPSHPVLMLQILNVCLWIGYLKWKFRLVLWSTIFFEAMVHIQLVAHYVATLNSVWVGSLSQFEIVNGSAPVSYLKKLSTSTFLIMPTCVMKMYTEMFERLLADFGLTTKCVNTGQFLTQELFADLVGSVLLRLSGGADNILLINQAFSNAPKVFLGEFLKVSIVVYETGQGLHIILLIFSTVIVQAHGKFVLLALLIPIFCYHRLSCLVCKPRSDYLRPKFDRRQRAVPFLYAMIYTPAVSQLVISLKWKIHILPKSFGSARRVKGINLDFILVVMFGCNFQILEQLENQWGNGNYKLQQLASNFDSQPYGIFMSIHVLPHYIGCFANTVASRSAVTTKDQATYMLQWMMAFLRWKYKLYSTD